MCSFLFTTWAIINLAKINFFLQKRGPDATTTTEYEGFTLVHNLLHMTGERVLQPFRDGNVFGIYNGEIYNSRAVPENYQKRHEYVSDGQCILPSYREHGEWFPTVLDGEWALSVLDFEQDKLILSTDVFGTKPLWYSFHEGVHASSYESALLELGLPKESIFMMQPNTIMVFDISGRKQVYKAGGEEFSHGEARVRFARAPALTATYTVHEFDLRQYKTSTDDWISAFERAVFKRTHQVNHPVFIGLSSGYDSGALHLAMEKVGSPHSMYSFTIKSQETARILQARLANFTDSLARAFTVTISLVDFDAAVRYLEGHSEPFEYSPTNWGGGTVQGDGASMGLSVIFKRCREAGLLVYLSGAGADEIISDYGFNGTKFFPHSSFGGKFPDDMSSFFPWQSVFMGTQRDYLMKEEIVGGSHSLEARYPFLDRQVVQEYIWLSPETKNEIYKRPVHDYLLQHGYPFEDGVKSGFSAGKNLLLFGKRKTETLFDSLDDDEHAHKPKTGAQLEAVAGGAGEKSGTSVAKRDLMNECDDFWMQV